MNTKNWNWNVILGVAAVLLIVIVSVCIFLFSADNGYTGVDALKDQSGAFWVWVCIGGSIGVASVFALIWADRKDIGGVGLTLALVIVAVMFLFNPFGRACTDKANHGITAPKHVAGE